MASEPTQTEMVIKLDFNIYVNYRNMGVETDRYMQERQLRAPKIDCNLLQPLRLQSFAVG
jgi:hypothetical protein